MKKLKNSIGIRLAIISFLTLVLLIPSLLIQGLISERENRRDSVVNEISQKWGNEQAIVGPVISIPYKHYYKSKDQVEQTTRYAHFLPEQLNIKGTITPEVRYRGIYKVIVYNGPARNRQAPKRNLFTNVLRNCQTSKPKRNGEACPR